MSPLVPAHEGEGECEFIVYLENNTSKIGDT